MLVNLVQNAGVLVRDRDLINAVWGQGKNISEGNITNHISKIRKALNCDKHNPRFIETYHGKRAYRFIGKVNHTRKPSNQGAHTFKRSRQFTIESHLITPVFLGVETFDNIRGHLKTTAWASYKEFKIDNGRLCVSPSGIGVWHLTERHHFGSFLEVAAWRHETYEKILNGGHGIHFYNEELKVPSRSRSNGIDPFGSILGKLGYVFSVLVLIEPEWASTDKMRKPLQLLSCLSPLENIDPAPASKDSHDLEHQILDGTYSNFDTIEFGLTGQDLGFACWDGLSYLQRTNGNSAIKDDIIDFEIAVQTTWWLSKCLYDICLEKGAEVKEELDPYIQALRWQYAKILRIVATESTAQRTMIEAILTTSRLHRLVEDTIKLYDQL